MIKSTSFTAVHIFILFVLYFDAITYEFQSYQPLVFKQTDTDGGGKTFEIICLRAKTKSRCSLQR